MPDKYASMGELYNNEPRSHYKLTTRFNPESSVFVVSPHGGAIEFMTSEIADRVASHRFNFHDFAGRLPKSNFAHLHVTSRNYDCYQVEKLNAESRFTLAIHGCAGLPEVKTTYLGGQDLKGRELVRQYLEEAGFQVEDAPPNLSGLGDDNFVNQNQRHMGIQLEISSAQRKELAEYLGKEGPSPLTRYCEALSSAMSMLSGELPDCTNSGSCQ